LGKQHFFAGLKLSGFGDAAGYALHQAQIARQGEQGWFTVVQGRGKGFTGALPAIKQAARAQIESRQRLVGSVLVQVLDCMTGHG